MFSCSRVIMRSWLRFSPKTRVMVLLFHAGFTRILSSRVVHYLEHLLFLLKDL